MEDERRFGRERKSSWVGDARVSWSSPESWPKSSLGLCSKKRWERFGWNSHRTTWLKGLRPDSSDVKYLFVLETLGRDVEVLRCHARDARGGRVGYYIASWQRLGTSPRLNSQ